jgi:hypothetical protein
MVMPSPSDPERSFLRHAVATVAYRGAKALRDAPLAFGELVISDYPRTPVKILAHASDLFDWALSIASGRQVWRDSAPQDWPLEVNRFFAALKSFDDYLAGSEPLHESPTQLFQGPIADALTHIGQLALLRRLGGHPIKGENYLKAHIAAGSVGVEQAAPRREFD